MLIIFFVVTISPEKNIIHVYWNIFLPAHLLQLQLSLYVHRTVWPDPLCVASNTTNAIQSINSRCVAVQIKKKTRLLQLWVGYMLLCAMHISIKCVSSTYMLTDKAWTHTTRIFHPILINSQNTLNTCHEISLLKTIIMICPTFLWTFRRDDFVTRQEVSLACTRTKWQWQLMRRLKIHSHYRVAQQSHTYTYMNRVLVLSHGQMRAIDRKALTSLRSFAAISSDSFT